ncbi:MAG: hypothetical protein CMJ83_05290 [Planctomycetes bacterium]|nr:hypothetical protein [Planctomycetota bacterium]
MNKLAMRRRTVNSPTGAVALSIIAMVICLASACQQAKQEVSGSYHNPYGVRVDRAGVVNRVSIGKEGRPTDHVVRPLPRGSRSMAEFARDKRPAKPATTSKISPVLQEWVKTRKGDSEIEVIINFSEDRRIPLMPTLPANQEREQRDTARAAAIRRLQSQRQRAQSDLCKALRKYGAFEVVEHFWLVNAVVAKLRLETVQSLGRAPQVIYMQPVKGGEKPPRVDAGPDDDDVDDARRLIVSDPYFNLGLTQPWIGIMDTGVRETHTLFTSPDRIAWMRDCVNGGPNGNDSSQPNFDPTDFFWNHGTSTAAIISGNNNLGNIRRGVTAVRLDSWQIYTAAGLDSAAAVRALQLGVAAFDRVLVGELQANEAEDGAIATAADNAYDAGAIIVSANGNFGPGASTVRSPAIAHKVLGVGNFTTDGQNQVASQGRGPATDGRWKPDIQTPTSSQTASNASDTALQVFTGTSGATPYAAGAAMLARNWLHRFGTYDNGQTYAFMILYGQNPWPYDQTSGAGRLSMAVNGWAWWGKYVITNGASIDIPINVTAGKKDFDAAIWWPETAAQNHNDVDVHLIDPGGTERAKGYSAAGVFERAKVAGTLSPGTWTLRIRGFWVRTGAQVVYMAAHVRN